MNEAKYGFYNEFYFFGLLTEKLTLREIRVNSESLIISELSSFCTC